MEVVTAPRPYPEWRKEPFPRCDDAAYLFGYYLMLHCREEALAKVPANASPEVKEAVKESVDIALHNLCDMLEGFWPLEAGPEHPISLSLGVQVRDSQNHVVETQEISPCKLDLPIGYWKWAENHEFR